MDVQSLKEYILNNDLIENLLKEIECHSIRNHGQYITCGNKSGDNKNSITVYLNENLTVINYTRQMVKNRRTTDIFDLICYNKECTFPESLGFTCNLFGLDFYSESEELPESLQILRMLREMAMEREEDDSKPLKPIPERILSYYLPYGNRMFKDDGIDLYVQNEFKVGYDPRSNYITIPIIDSLGFLVGIKGRYLGKADDNHLKYIYLEKCNKSKLLYGYYQNQNYIKHSNVLYITESEKGVMQLATIGVRNAVATGGKAISKTQVEFITRTGCTPIFAYDADVTKEELEDIATMFLEGITVKAIIDKDNILNEKESPSDNPDKWNYLINNSIYDIKRENRLKIIEHKIINDLRR